MIFVAAVIAILISAVILARRNWCAGNADRLGATKMFGFILMMSLFYWLFQSHHVPGSEEFLLIAETSARGILRGVLVCAAYLAIEPYVRRLWPHTLIGWNRLLRGRFGDALVGRHVLAGIVGGVLAQLLGSAGLMFGNARQIVLLPEPIVGIGSGPFSLRPLMGPQVALGQLCAEMMVALVCGFVVVALFFFVLRTVFRKTWLTIVVYALFFSTSIFIKGDIQGA